MKNKRKQIMISSLIMLVVAAMALTTTTLAWFTTGNTGKVEDFEFKAVDASGIQLSVDAENWKSTITSTDIKTQVDADTSVVGKAQTGSLFTTQSKEFIPLSTVANAVEGKLTMYKTEADNEKLKSSALLAGENFYYVFNIYVNNLGSSAKDLKLTTASVTGDDYNTQLAARIAFIDQGSVSKLDKTAAATKAAVIAAADAEGIVIYEPNASTHTGFAKTYLGVTDTKQDYYGLKAAGSYATTDGFINSTEESGVEKVNTIATTGSAVALLNADSITKLTVYVWIEGQDCDCNNDIASGTVTVNFGFTATEAEGAATYTLAYNAEGASNVPSSAAYAEGTQVKLNFTDVPVLEGKIFKGWATNNEGTGTVYTAANNTFVMGKEAITLYAVWADGVAVTYNANGVGAEMPAGHLVEKGVASAISSVVPTFEGKTFVKWNTQADGNGTDYEAGAEITTEEEVALYAIWEDITE